MKTYYQTPPPDTHTRPDLLFRALDIFAHVPGVWINVPGYTDHALFQCADTGLRLDLCLGQHSKQATIRQEQQIGPNGYRYFYHGTRPAPAINCNPTRSDQGIAGDITRRLLPDARHHFPRETAQIAQWYAEEERREQAQQLLAQVGGGDACSWRRESVYGQGWEARTSGEFVELHISRLDLETACAVLEMIQK